MLDDTDRRLLRQLLAMPEAGGSALADRVGLSPAAVSRRLERLRATGVTPGQLFALVLMQTGLMGLLAGLLALPIGWHGETGGPGGDNRTLVQSAYLRHAVLAKM